MLTGVFSRITLNNGDQTHMPIVRASVTTGGHTSEEVDGLVDTGASINLISISSAKAILGITKDRVKTGRKLLVSGLGKDPVFSYGFQVNINLRATTVSTEYISLSNVWLYVGDGEIPICQMLIGQSHGLEEKIFVHLNRNEKRYWRIKF